MAKHLIWVRIQIMSLRFNSDTGKALCAPQILKNAVLWPPSACLPTASFCQGPLSSWPVLQAAVPKLSKHPESYWVQPGEGLMAERSQSICFCLSPPGAITQCFLCDFQWFLLTTDKLITAPDPSWWVQLPSSNSTAFFCPANEEPHCCRRCFPALAWLLEWLLQSESAECKPWAASQCRLPVWPDPSTPTAWSV